LHDDCHPRADIPAHAAAKDKPQLRTGTAHSGRVNDGIDCQFNGSGSHLYCGTDSSDYHGLTLADGTTLSLRHALRGPDVIRQLPDGASVQYSIRREMGVTYYVVISPTTGKEGWYYVVH
jgi:hypothetical protein